MTTINTMMMRRVIAASVCAFGLILVAPSVGIAQPSDRPAAGKPGDTHQPADQPPDKPATKPGGTAPDARRPAAAPPPKRRDAARPAARRKAGDDDDDDDDDDFDTSKAKKVKKVPKRSTSPFHPDAWSDPNSVPKIDRIVNQRLARTVRKYTFMFIVDHRTQDPAFTKDIFDNYFGFDSGSLKIGLGLRFGILETLDVGFLRLNNGKEVFDTYELDIRWHFLQQKKHQIDMGIIVGATWFYQRGFFDSNGNGIREDDPNNDGRDDDKEKRYTSAAGGYAQLIIHRTFFRRWTIGVSAMFHSDATSDIKSNKDKAWSFAVGFFTSIRISKLLEWTAEVQAGVAGWGLDCLKGDARINDGVPAGDPRTKCEPAFSSSLKFHTHRHTFSLVLSNTNYYSQDGIVANTSKRFSEKDAGGTRRSGLIVGFSITRELAF